MSEVGLSAYPQYCALLPSFPFPKPPASAIVTHGGAILSFKVAIFYRIGFQNSTITRHMRGNRSVTTPAPVTFGDGAGLISSKLAPLAKISLPRKASHCRSKLTGLIRLVKNTSLRSFQETVTLSALPSPALRSAEYHFTLLYCCLRPCQVAFWQLQEFDKFRRLCYSCDTLPFEEK